MEFYWIFDNDNLPVSLGILNASKKLDVPKDILGTLAYFKMTIAVTTTIP